MTYQERCEAIKDPSFSSFDNDTELCLWQAQAEGWEKAHIIVESLPEPGASWIHAMLHREEGDVGNAMYWYSRARKQMPSDGTTIEQEWHQIARALLES